MHRRAWASVGTCNGRLSAGLSGTRLGVLLCAVALPAGTYSGGRRIMRTVAEATASSVLYLTASGDCRTYLHHAGHDRPLWA
jgi:hypothetical protein